MPPLFSLMTPAASIARIQRTNLPQTPKKCHVCIHEDKWFNSKDGLLVSSNDSFIFENRIWSERIFMMSGGGGLVVNVAAFYPENSRLNPTFIFIQMFLVRKSFRIADTTLPEYQATLS